MARVRANEPKRIKEKKIMLTEEEFELLDQLASDKNLTSSEFMRRRIFSKPIRNFSVTRIVNELSQNSREIKAVGRMVSEGKTADPIIRQQAMEVLIAIEQALWDISKQTYQARQESKRL